MRCAGVIAMFVWVLLATGAAAQEFDPQKLGLLQSVQLLEMKLFGRTFFGGPIQKRINRLEEVVGLPHNNSVGMLVRIQAIEKRIPTKRTDKLKAAERAIEAENEQISDKLWQNLTVPGVGVKVVEASTLPPSAVTTKTKDELIAAIEESASNALASTLAHTFGSVAVGAECHVECVIENGKVEVKLTHPSQFNAFNESIEKGIGSLSGTPLLAEHGQRMTVLLRTQVVKEQIDQSDPIERR